MCESSTFFGYGPWLRMIKDLRMIKNPCAHIQEERGEKGNRRMKQVSRGAKEFQEYFR